MTILSETGNRSFSPTRSERPESSYQVGALTWEEIAAEYQRLSLNLETAIEDLYEAGKDWAEKDNNYRIARASAFVGANGKNKEEREAKADPKFSNERLEASLAESLKEACLEKVRGLRTQMSAFQTIVAARRAEQQATSYGQTGGI